MTLLGDVSSRDQGTVLLEVSGVWIRHWMIGFIMQPHFLKKPH